MVLTNTMLVSAASVGAADVYKGIYEETVVMEQEELQPSEKLIEYEMPGFPEGAVIEEGEVQGNAKGTTWHLDWGVGIDIYKRTDRFEAEAGDEIWIAVAVMLLGTVGMAGNVSDTRWGYDEDGGVHYYTSSGVSLTEMLRVKEDDTSTYMYMTGVHTLFLVYIFSYKWNCDRSVEL